MGRRKKGNGEHDEESRRQKIETDLDKNVC
jgi:hypothetical protein